VRDEEQAELQFAAQAVQQIQDLFLDVSRARWWLIAISSRGPAASAMAIMARWRKHPRAVWKLLRASAAREGRESQGIEHLALHFGVGKLRLMRVDGFFDCAPMRITGSAGHRF